MSGAMKLSLRWLSAAERLNRELEQDLDLLSSKLEETQRLQAIVQDDLLSCKEMSRQHEAVVKALNDENRGYSDVLVPQLVALHKLIQQRLEAEIAVEVRRQVAFQERRPDAER
jgi:lysine/ornithine N-monooxygenase